MDSAGPQFAPPEIKNYTSEGSADKNSVPFFILCGDLNPV